MSFFSGLPYMETAIKTYPLMVNYLGKVLSAHENYQKIIFLEKELFTDTQSSVEWGETAQSKEFLRRDELWILLGGGFVLKALSSHVHKVH